MNARTCLLWPTVVLAAVLALGSCASQRYTPKPDEELYGTWVNPQAGFGKVVFFAGGCRFYLFASDATPRWQMKSRIDASWTDTDGNVWYKLYAVDSTGYSVLQELHKINKSGTQDEVQYVNPAAYSWDAYPARLDPADPHYGVYQRAAQ